MHMASPPTIFVQIASYRDPECQWTVKDLFEKAEHPEQVTVGICAQCDPELDKDCFVVPSPRPAQTKMINVRPHESEGVCWARAKTQELFEDQDYVLMIDSHMRFIQNWDTELIAELKRCGSPKSFLSTYPPGYKPPNDLEKNPKPIVMRAKPFTPQGDIRFEGEVLSRIPERPLRGAFLAAGLLFAPGKFVREVPYDRRIYFNQEEITLATRAFTHGWDVYSPTKSFVYHYYNEPKRGEVRPLHWHDNKDWTQLQTLSIQRARYLLAGEKPADPKALEEIDRYGMGKARSLADYEAFSGIDFKNKVSTERATRSQFIEGLDQDRKPSEPLPNAARLLKEGDVLVPVTLKDAGGNPRSTGDFSGAPCLVCVLPYSFDTYTKDFMTKFRGKAAGIGVIVIFVAPLPLGEAADFAARNNLPPDMLVDEEYLIGRLFGYSARLRDTPLTVALDKGQVVRGIYDNRNSDNHVGDVLRAAAMLKSAS
jgi:peroxiredoxin